MKFRFSCAALGICFGVQWGSTPILKGRTREIEGRLAEAALHRVLLYYEIFAVHALAVDNELITGFQTISND